MVKLNTVSGRVLRGLVDMRDLKSICIKRVNGKVTYIIKSKGE